MDCSSASSAAEISSALTKASWPSTQLWRFLTKHNTEVVELREGFFGVLSFQQITIDNTAVKEVHPSAMLPLKHFHTDLGIYNSLLKNFPFHILHEFQHLKELWLYNNLLTSVPAFKSDSLEILNLRDNEITSVEFDGWATPKLRELYLHNNLLTSVRFLIEDNTEVVELPEGFFGVLSFQQIRINNTAVKKVHSSAMLPLKHFNADLGIYNSLLKSFPFHILHVFQHLKQLWLHKNLLTSVPAFKSDSLEILSLRDNKITSVEFDGWATPKLRELYLENNLLTSVPAFKSDSLEILRLDNNTITSVEFDGWATPKLRELWLYNNLLTSVPAFKSNSLEILSLRDNTITSVEFDGWANPKLRELYLENNLLTSVPAFKIDGLEILRLDNNTITSVEFDGWAIVQQFVDLCAGLQKRQPRNTQS
ncbi:unnamed protein product [Darwinula stevensoni]|uniref:Uncharacterized protein n=1 Tax=Darwinula stevensoni TaxID=69355 RepID=A0A7R9ACK9_9CRUS|nr:unnamed protein product [Darwinula stevensoni]CAG0899918.1 unnamed protein product [Darwinula stevensoni]